MEEKEAARLLGDPELQKNGDYGSEAFSEKQQPCHEDSSTLKERGWSFQENRRAIATASIRPTRGSESNESKDEEQKGLQFYMYCVIYAFVNVIISAPGCM